MKKLILTLALLFYTTTLCPADVLEDLKMIAASDGFTYKGIEHMSAAYYRFVNGPREVWIPVSIKDDWGEMHLAWTAGSVSAFWTWSMTREVK
jgi:hypothetical protein